MMSISSADKFYDETIAKMFLQFYEHTAQVVWNQFVEATWDYVTNTTKKNQEHMLHKDVEKSQHSLYFGSQAGLFEIARFQDPTVRRMLSKLQNREKAALTKDELQEVMDGAPSTTSFWPP
ncbi:Angiotensin-Converting Enzyme [Manis pentadactyla]|nr:Angiotensin-Converting Enzyme [Manis pentadactyla]